jgi:hypothetical protein
MANAGRCSPNAALGLFEASLHLPVFMDPGFRRDDVENGLDCFASLAMTAVEALAMAPRA